MAARPPLLVALALAAVRLVARIVPRRDRDAWRREWEHELLNGHLASRREPGSPLRSQIRLLRRSLGSVADAAWLRRQLTRDADMIHDIRHTLRLLAARPAFTIVAVVVLAVGLGAAIATAGVVQALLLRTPAIPEPDRLVAVWERNTASSAPRQEVAPANFLDWRESATTLVHMAAIEPWSVDYTGGDRPEILLAAKVSEGFFDALGVTPLHGRFFQPDDYTVRKGLVVVLDHGVWQRRFGADPSIVGRTIPLDGTPHTVVGVLPASLDLPFLLNEHGTRDAWLPQLTQAYHRTSRESGWWAVIARLKDGASIDTTRAEMQGISTRLAARHPRTNANVVASVEPFDEHLKSAVRPALLAMLGAVALVVLIVCANVANLLLARALEREREFAVRNALGASRSRLVRQVITESLVIGVTGTACGVAIAWALLRAVLAMAPESIVGLEHAALDGRVLGFAVTLGLATAVGFGIVPALQTSRPDAGDGLKEGRSSTGTRRAGRVRDGLAVVEVALAVIVVIGAGLLVRSFVAMVRVDTGFDADRVAVVQVFAYDRNNRTAAQRVEFFRETVDRMRRLPGVANAGAVSAMPFLPANINIETGLTIEGRPPVSPDEAPRIFVSAATDGYFETMGIPVVRGRTFTPQDDARAERVAVVSESLARRFWPDGNPIDAHVTVRFAGAPARARIIGVVRELRHDGYDAPSREELFLAQAQTGFGSMTYVVRTTGDPAAVVGPAQDVVWALDPLQTIYDTATVPELLAASVAPRRLALMLMASFAVVALVLAAAGIYGVMSVATGQRTREFGVRLALGATRSEIARLVLRHGAAIGGAGVALGLAVSLAGGRLFDHLLFQIGAADPAAIAVTVAVVLGITLLATLVPARRATRVDPCEAMRQ
jgi:putative ABC transport system permease protein